jgi:hypothetical protein
MYSLFGCCKACEVNPREWLTDVLSRIPAYNSDYSKDLAELLPHNWKASRNLLKNPTIVLKYPEFCGKIRTIADFSISVLKNPKLSRSLWKI